MCGKLIPSCIPIYWLMVTNIILKYNLYTYIYVYSYTINHYIIDIQLYIYNVSNVSKKYYHWFLIYNI